MEQSKPRSIVLRRSKNVKTIIQRLFLHSCFGSSLFQLWDLSPVGFCGLIRYSEKLFSFKSPSADDDYWDNFRRGQSWAAWQKTKGLLRAEWVLIGMSGKSMHFHLLLSFRLNKRHIAMHCTQNFQSEMNTMCGLILDLESQKCEILIHFATEMLLAKEQKKNGPGGVLIVIFLGLIMPQCP